ncbi:TetR/AcrR family transcriptional regulator [Streptomyces sp. NPDC020951]|uniref:TetR/AcrR family transcriptional regulator n=1 Tax=Streptomyces sp. NPDC020951 TaxID=3365104 RepID=UPI0037A0F046
MSQRGAYHHGDLRAALVAAALDIVSERGVAGLSVAEAARRTGVSTAAPYRHFPSRTALLSAAATQSGRQLLEEMRAACDEVRKRLGTADHADPHFAVEALAATARVYVIFAVAHGAAFELILADELQDHPDAERREVSRQIMDLLLWPAVTLTGEPAAATQFLWRFTAVVHGFAYLPGSGFIRGHAVGADFMASQAADVIRTLARAAIEGSSANHGSEPATPATE